MVNARISFVRSFTTVIAFLFCFYTANATVNGTSCYKCTYHSSMPADKRFCNATLQTCKPEQTYCGEYSVSRKPISGRKGYALFGKGCFKSEQCKDTTKTCEDAKVKFNYSACSVSCCKGSGCNSAPIVSPISSKMSIFGLIVVISFGILFV